MLKNSASVATTSKPNTNDLVEMALSGRCPGLLTSLLAPGLTDTLFRQIEGSSKKDASRHT